MKTIIENVLCDFYDSYENKAEAIMEIEDIINEITNNPKTVIKGLKDLSEEFKEKLISDGRCPECGAKLEWVSDSRKDTFVPYQNYSVSLEDGGYYECPECDYIKED